MSPDLKTPEIDDVETDDRLPMQPAAGDDQELTTPKRRARSAVLRSWLRRQIIPLLTVTLVLGAAASTAVIYLEQYRPDQRVGAAVAASVVKAASNGTVAVLSYKPETAEQDFARAKSYLTGDFLPYYDQFTQQVVTPAVKQKGVRTSAQVIKAAVSQIQPDSAQVLVFVDQTTSSTQNPTPSVAASSVRITLQNSGGTWLISSFDPVR